MHTQSAPAALRHISSQKIKKIKKKNKKTEAKKKEERIGYLLDFAQQQGSQKVQWHKMPYLKIFY